MQQNIYCFFVWYAFSLAKEAEVDTCFVSDEKQIAEISMQRSQAVLDSVSNMYFFSQ